mmetsp:Transcript_9826/g.8659  ORF Transcript_9826/g.8659 Transcript_9826/m.8659 type:complete len:136 (-) Transcript_9826:4884-5291(-)
MNTSLKSTAYQCTMKGEKIFKEETMFENPGPGAYNSQSTLAHKDMTIGIKREDIEGSNPLGPGVYNLPERELTHEEAPKWTIKRKFNLPTDENNLGPGEYNAKEIECSCPGPIIQQRPKDINYNDNPGPGHYNPK